MGARDQQGMAGEQRAVIEERDRLAVLEHDQCLVGLTAGDAAEGAVAPSNELRARPIRSGRTIGGAFGSSASSTSTSPNPERLINSGVGRLGGSHGRTGAREA